MNHLPQVLMLLGSGELGKEVAIEAKRLGCCVIACDRYANAPAMQIADKFEIFDMNDKTTLKTIIQKHSPDLVIPEIEALAVSGLIELENEGIKVIPNAKATEITMNRDKIRDLAAKELKLKTAKYEYASSKEELGKKVRQFKWPVLIKPVMSSSGKGQSLAKDIKSLNEAWDIAMEGARGNSPRVIIEEFLSFDLEITLLTIRQQDGTTLFCDPIGHEQINGDYQCSWQPAQLNQKAHMQAQEIAKKVTECLGGTGIFGVEFFICGEEVIFSELSPRPHDTGLVTVISQNYSEFELHVRAILGLPIPKIKRLSCGASQVILSSDTYSSIAYTGVSEALKIENTKLLFFGKPSAKKGRRMGVALAEDNEIDIALKKAKQAAHLVKVIKNPTPD